MLIYNNNHSNTEICSYAVITQFNTSDSLTA